MSRNLSHGLSGNRVLVDLDNGDNLAFVPLFDRLLVRPQKTREKTKGGIIVPDSAKIEETIGEVIAVGHGTFDDKNQFIDRPALFAPGDMVVFKEFTGVHVTLPIDGEITRLLMIWDRDVLGVLKKVNDD